MARFGLSLILASTTLLVLNANAVGILGIIVWPCLGLVVGLGMIYWAINQPPRQRTRDAKQDNQS